MISIRSDFRGARSRAALTISSGWVRAVVILSIPVLSSACRPYAAFSPPAPEEEAALAGLVEDDPTNVELSSRLAVARLIRNDIDAARSLLERTAALVPEDPAIPLLLALASEEDRIADAADVYDRYTRDHGGPLSELAAARLAYVRSRAYRQQAVRTVTGLSETPAETHGVLVLPFAYAVGDEAAEAASTILQMLISADFERRRLAPVDPQRARIAWDAMGFARGRLADPVLGAEIGRYFGADLVVQGALGASTDSEETDITLLWIGARDEEQDTLTRIALPTDPAQLGEAGRRISTYIMNIIEGRPQTVRSFGEVLTGDGTAALAAGRAALALDVDDAAAATTFATEALRIDPSFRIAADLLERAERMASVVATPFEDAVLEVARLGALQRSVISVRADTESAHRSALSRVGRRDRIIASDLLGLDRMVTGVLLQIHIGGIQ